jgi:predicted nuclease of predicted toxin-antitoxin system
MRVLLDMNLSPTWVGYLAASGINAVHWSTVGNPSAPDSEVLDWARHEGCIVFTHDLDLGTIVALTAASGPSVIQVRTQAVLPDQIGALIVSIIQQHAPLLNAGAILTVDELAARARVLPIGRQREAPPG